jgi:hypothetical protein
MDSDDKDCAHQSYPELETQRTEEAIPLQVKSVWGLHEDTIPGIRVSDM